MPTRRLPDADPFGETRLREACRDSDHGPSMMLVRDPGTYEHTCPACGTVTFFRVPEGGTL